MQKIYNFSAGPSVLPAPVLKVVQQELLSYEGSGMSVMELSHRSSLFKSIIEEAEALLRELMAIPSNYKVLSLQGGASLQFSMVPMNLGKQKVAYVDTGIWSTKAILEARKIKDLTVDVIASSAESKFKNIPDISSVDQTYDYLHITTNNTVAGTTFYTIPDAGNVPIVADMSSSILSYRFNVSDFGLIYAGAQKNIGPAGLTIVIIREDLVNSSDELPTMLNYKTHAEHDSMYNTPPTFAIYVAKRAFEWLRDRGGVDAIEKYNREKAAILYAALHESALFFSPVEKEFRSMMNIPFVTGNAEQEARFITEAENKGLVNLKGHKSVGGMRASTYNAFPIEGVEALVAFMKEFELKEGAKR